MAFDSTISSTTLLLEIWRKRKGIVKMLRSNLQGSIVILVILSLPPWI